ncbi:MAG: family 10 glycosylhydrolase [Ferruginibacter sp.]
MKFFLLVFFISSFYCSVAQQGKKEFRGVWIATIDNIDWPDTPRIGAEQQKASFIKLLDMHKKNGMNAIVFQIRPAADAFYPSPYEPWSQWLTGVQGVPPVPLYDPLEFMIAETHRRGMEFHAWMNPYRAVFNITRSSVAADHITRTRPEWFVTYGGKKYFDPALPAAQDFVTEIVKDVVKRYKPDAIHFDDYFYPYPLPGIPFPDDVTYRKNSRGLSKAAWRRSNTDSIILKVSTAIKQVNKNCRFGISPFGIWRNANADKDGSLSKGLSNYDDLYADILLWLKKGWIDYVAPQLYWAIGNRSAPFEVMTEWWSRHTYGKDCYIGIGYYMAGYNAAWRDKTQIPRQIRVIRNTPNMKGMIFYSSRSFEKNPYGWNDSLRTNYFK